MLLGFLADVWQWACSVPSGRGWADPLGKQCGAGGAQVIALGVGVDRQRHRRIVAVPGRDDVHWHAAGQHKADAGIAKALEVYAAQAGALTQALEFVGVPLMADWRAVLPTAIRRSSDQRVPKASASACWRVLNSFSALDSSAGSGRSRRLRRDFGIPSSDSLPTVTRPRRISRVSPSSADHRRPSTSERRNP